MVAGVVVEVGGCKTGRGSHPESNHDSPGPVGCSFSEKVVKRAEC